MVLSEHEQELLSDLVASAGWQVLCFKVLPERLRTHAEKTFSAVRGDAPHDAATAVGKYDGIMDAITSAYDAANTTIPDMLKRLKRSA
jgi:hypothetical protein